MRYNRHFEYEVCWAGEYIYFQYLQEARRFLKNKSVWTIYKVWTDDTGIIKTEWVEESI